MLCWLTRPRIEERHSRGLKSTRQRADVGYLAGHSLSRGGVSNKSINPAYRISGSQNSGMAVSFVGETMLRRIDGSVRATPLPFAARLADTGQKIVHQATVRAIAVIERLKFSRSSCRSAGVGFSPQGGYVRGVTSRALGAVSRTSARASSRLRDIGCCRRVLHLLYFSLPNPIGRAGENADPTEEQPPRRAPAAREVSNASP
jgi:hypothetical protein